MQTKQIERAIRSLNQASIDDEYWRTALKSVADLFNASIVQSVTFDKANDELIDVTSINQDNSVDQKHKEYYAQISPRIGSIKDGKIPIAYDYMFIDEYHMRKHEFYEACKKSDAYYLLGANELGDEKYACGIGFFRSENYGHADRDEIHLMEKLWPHLAAAVRVRRAISSSTQFLGPLLEAITLINQPAFIVGEGGKIHLANAHAEKEMSKSSSLKMSENRLFSYYPQEQTQLNQLIEDALAVSRGERIFFEHSELLIRCEAPAPAIRVIVQPLTATSSFMARKKGWVLLMTKSQDQRRDRQFRRLLDDFHLTQAEVGVALAMADGVRVAEYAKQKGVSVNTVRFQLRAVFEKTETSRQAELVCKILSL